MGVFVALGALLLLPVCVRAMLRRHRTSRIRAGEAGSGAATSGSRLARDLPMPQVDASRSEEETERLIANGRMTSMLGREEYRDLMELLARSDEHRSPVYVPELRGD